jgi:hypothetical protein
MNFSKKWATMNEPPIQLSVKQLLERDDYLIPMYQRNYAWGEGEIRQLIRDVIDYLPNGRNYYVGSLVVSERSPPGSRVYETIDGQQRLTTLTLLACFLKNETCEDMDWYDRLGIRFESRDHSTKTLWAIFKGTLVNGEPESLQGMTINGAILTGYRLIQQCLNAELKENGVTLARFVEFLLNRVCIMRVKVSDDMDLNHYFEIMNNRGEQLEKHEVLKSRLMESLDKHCPEEEREKNRRCIYAVWEACADMERYVQMGFLLSKRDAVFGSRDWGRFVPTDFDSLRDILESAAVNIPGGEEELNLDEIIKQEATDPLEGKGDEPTPERFNAVVNFPNFLLHVLRVATGKNIALDDKRLILEFENYVFNAEDPGKEVKRFVFSLLRCKYLLDHYVLKREFLGGKDHWSLKRCKWNAGSASYVNTFGNAGEEEADDGTNRRILMLLSAFHVSTPTMDYKYWLNAALNHLFSKTEIEMNEYLEYLESVARAFVFDRFLSEGAGADYYQMIHVREGRCQTEAGSLSAENIAPRLSFHEIGNNLVFNYLDYLLWLRHSGQFAAIRNWEFTFRSSREHFYPQTPMEGLPALPTEILDSFGNLCLISHSKNSRLSNFTPRAKRELYPNGSFDSIKQRLMLDEPEWNSETIQRHQKMMIECLLGLQQPSNA